MAVTKRHNPGKRLNIAHFHWGFPPIIGGVETHLTIILPEMAKRGHNVSLMTGSFEGVEDRYVYKGVKIYRTPLMDLSWLHDRGLKGLEKELNRVFKKFLKETEPDVVHVHNMHYFSEVHIKILEKLIHEIGAKLFLTAHNVWDDLLFLEATGNIEWDHVIAVSHYIKKELFGSGLIDTKITVIHHGVDQNSFRPVKPPQRVYRKYPKLKRRPVIFHPARIGLAKGCDVSIKALNMVKKRIPDVVFIFAGSKNIIDWEISQKKEIAYLVNLIEHLGLKDNVLIDMFPLSEMRDMYAVSDAVIYPSSVGEPFGLVMLEAMAMAKPIIVTEMGGMPEIVKDGINGFVVKHRDFEALAYSIIQVLEDSQLRNRLGITGRQMVEAQYNKNRVTQETLAIYRKYLFKKQRTESGGL